jgi:hypothetical protein
MTDHTVSCFVAGELLVHFDLVCALVCSLPVPMCVLALNRIS